MIEIMMIVWQNALHSSMQMPWNLVRTTLMNVMFTGRWYITEIKKNGQD